MDLISVTSGHGGGVEVRVRDHRWTCDLSREDGGSGLGPAPSELLAASLGACIGLMVESWCRRQGCAEGGVRVSLTCEMAGKPARLASIVADLELPPDLPEEKRAAALRVAQACPIHAALTDPPRIDLELA